MTLFGKLILDLLDLVAMYQRMNLLNERRI
jgi:hypothetical protein